MISRKNGGVKGFLRYFHSVQCSVKNEKEWMHKKFTCSERPPYLIVWRRFDSNSREPRYHHQESMTQICIGLTKCVISIQ